MRTIEIYLTYCEIPKNLLIKVYLKWRKKPIIETQSIVIVLESTILFEILNKM